MEYIHEYKYTEAYTMAIIRTESFSMHRAGVNTKRGWIILSDRKVFSCDYGEGRVTYLSIRLASFYAAFFSSLSFSEAVAQVFSLSPFVPRYPRGRVIYPVNRSSLLVTECNLTEGQTKHDAIRDLFIPFSYVHTHTYIYIYV